MKRIGAVLLAVLVIASVFSLSLFQSGHAQDQTAPRLSALETAVAGQAKQIKDLTKRVKALESAKPAAEATTASSSAGGANSFKGSGQAVKKVHLAARLYIVTAHSDGGFFFVTVLDSSGTIVDNSVTISDPQHDGSAALTISTDGDYVFQINGTSGWTMSIAPS